MTFWDSSALLPLLVEETRSSRCRALRRAHPAVAVWFSTRTELTSALHRHAREGALTRAGLSVALHRLDALAGRWTEVEAVNEVRDRAERLLGAHPLTAADALQLGAALVLVSERPRRRPLITADERLADAAAAEGFSVQLP
jgi:predicted nucleic acid-binding protein